ncbi:Na+/H+ antiporter NhaA [Pectobacterium brasiliense]|uniref:Na(+)/H(+) antiporter NhaA n=1 Tax=Pectobacterium brasiliense TaxID=180957 RepID=A0A3S1FJQ9_9GAMM|nr:MULTISPECIES: Na+/H+ antiporter NhaA [Pectobacterium]GKW29109.1 Na(+)/H(+) antiporter NhaA [Pectobacterium carotovorum subsp. carotovorum]ATV45265.1 Na+/H+ antiporter NhaA [Pectobacterium brasiliense]KFF65928.1 pH-dependent sodium/proton antiporter [Pectobacterium brasiliense]MBA0209984.1 Na+/H+ antiporter NhaA [Pectobacterium brasiliense]MBN3042751.1 Na+/H+ antiporter NhaA [Pectobacterium brasiliense]
MITMIRRFIGLDAAAGVMLMMTTVLAIAFANWSVTAAGYQQFLMMPVEMRFGALEINKNLLLWINDGLMAIFFLLIGLEVKRELVEGTLASRQQAMLPLAAAVGGMMFPALLFLLFNGNDEATRAGWAIPAATDIAFAIGVLTLLGKRVPAGLKVFLLALAIIDDLGAILIIALFYTQQIFWPALGGAVLAIAALAYMNRQQVGKTSAYLLVGIVLWVCILKCGVHATLAGVIVGFFIPLRTSNGEPSPATTLEHGLQTWVAFLIIPLFAFANAGIVLQGIVLEKLFSPLSLGIAAGLLIGKPLGITLFSWLTIRLGYARLPAGVHFSQIVAVSVLCGIGFTMSIFITLLAFSGGDAELITYAKLGILLASGLAALLGYLALRVVLPTLDKVMQPCKG